MNNKKEFVKKIVLLALFFAVLAFLCIERDSFRESVRIYNKPDFENCEQTKVSMLGNHVVEQDVVMKSDIIRTVGIIFSNTDSESAAGTVKVELIDGKGNVIADTELDASMVKEGSITKFLLGGDSEDMNTSRIVTNHDVSTKSDHTDVVKGATYTVRVTADNVTSKGNIDIVLIKYGSDKGIPPVVVDGETIDGSCAHLYVANRMFAKKTVALILALLVLTLIFILIPFRRIDEWIMKRSGKRYLCLSPWISRIMFILTPLVAYFIIQKYVGYTPSRFIAQLTSAELKGPLNLLIIGLIWWAIYTISRSTKLTSILTVLLSSAFGFTNYMLFLFRDSPLVATDFAQFGTALQVAGTYVLTFDKDFMWAFLITALWCIAAAVPASHVPATGSERPEPQDTSRVRKALKRRIIPLIILVLWGGAFYYIFFGSSYIEDHNFHVSSFKPRETYISNGCAMSFVITWRNSVIKKPSGYDVASIESIADKYESDKAVPADGVNEKTPNVIVVMNESFSDLSVLGDFETNQDYMPFYRSLSGDNVIKGTMHSSVYGGSTANSEFEFLTGFNMKYLPYMSVPFRSVIKEETPSLADYMKSLGYGGNIAFHPGMADSYNRNVVYPLLGFDRHIAYEDLKDPRKIRDYVSDEYDYEYVEREYEKYREKNAEEPFYMFNVTIQNHAGYTYGKGVIDAGIEILTPEAREEQAEQFLNLMKRSDEALEQLISYYSNVDEDTIIILYGDHQPRVGTEFYDALRSQHGKVSELQWSDMLHEVPFMIWANFDLKADDNSKNNENGDKIHLSANYIAPYVKSLMGMPLTGWDKYLIDLSKELPVVNAICCIDAEGNVIDPSTPSAYDEKLSEYEQIQYNGLIDHDHRVDRLFDLKK